MARALVRSRRDRAWAPARRREALSGGGGARLFREAVLRQRAQSHIAGWADERIRNGRIPRQPARGSCDCVTPVRRGRQGQGLGNATGWIFLPLRQRLFEANGRVEQLVCNSVTGRMSRLGSEARSMPAA